MDDSSLRAEALLLAHIGQLHDGSFTDEASGGDAPEEDFEAGSPVHELDGASRPPNPRAY